MMSASATKMRVKVHEQNMNRHLRAHEIDLGLAFQGRSIINQVFESTYSCKNCDARISEYGSKKRIEFIVTRIEKSYKVTQYLGAVDVI